MKREIIRGEGVQGMRLTINVCDMFTAATAADELWDVIENHEDCDNYAKCPFDQRKEQFPNGQPKRIEVSEKTLKNLHKLLNKLSYASKSTLFDAYDEEEDKKNETLVKGGPGAWPTEPIIGESKNY